MSRRLRFTADAIMKLDLPVDGMRETYYDTGCRGLCVRVSHTGCKTFLLQHKIRGLARKIRLGQFRTDGTGLSVDEARRQTRILIGRIECGDDPQLERNAKRSVPTLGDYFESWLNQHGRFGVTESTWVTKRGQFNKHCGKLAGRRMDQITKEQTRSMLTGMLDNGSGPRTANGVRTILNQMYRQAIDDGVLLNNHVVPLHPKFKVPVGRGRIVSREEMPRLIKALLAYEGTANSDPLTMRMFILMLLFTGQRRGNVLGMRWDQVDMATRNWLVSADQTKTRRVYNTRLSDHAWGVFDIQRQRWFGITDWVFPNAEDPSVQLKGPKKAWDTIRNKAGMPDLRMHDLRHTYATYQLQATGNLKLLQLNLHHQEIRTTADIYAHLDSEERLRDAAAAGCDSMVTAAGPDTMRLLIPGNGEQLLASA